MMSKSKLFAQWYKIGKLYGTMVQNWKTVQKDGAKLENYFENQNIYQNSILRLMSMSILNMLNVKIHFLIQESSFPILKTIYGMMLKNWKTIYRKIVQNWKKKFENQNQKIK